MRIHTTILNNSNEKLFFSVMSSFPAASLLLRVLLKHIFLRLSKYAFTFFFRSEHPHHSPLHYRCDPSSCSGSHHALLLSVGEDDTVGYCLSILENKLRQWVSLRSFPVSLSRWYGRLSFIDLSISFLDYGSYVFPLVVREDKAVDYRLCITVLLEPSKMII